MEEIKPYEHKVNYYETDKMGITHHSNYVRIMEEARIDFLDKLGWSFIKLEEQGVASPVMSIECSFKKPTTFPDVIQVYVTVQKLSAVKLTLGYEFKCNDQVVFTATSLHCFLDLKGAPVILEKRFPDFYNDLKAIVKNEP